jgi:antitoxin VapB
MPYLRKAAAMSKAKIFWSGRSQAVRLPKEFRFPGEEVLISRRGSAVVLEPVADSWDWLDGVSRNLDRDFVETVNEESDQQKRPELEKLFR